MRLPREPSQMIQLHIFVVLIHLPSWQSYNADMERMLGFLILYVSLCFAATIPSQTGSIYLASSNTTVLTGVPELNVSQSPSSLRHQHVAGFPLPEHNAFMRIQYNDSEPLSETLCRQLLTGAVISTLMIVDEHGDETLLEEDYQAEEGELRLFANRDEHSPTVTLTYGILLEALSMLRFFLTLHSFASVANLFEGLDGRGPPIGEIEVWAAQQSLA